MKPLGLEASPTRRTSLTAQEPARKLADGCPGLPVLPVRTTDPAGYCDTAGWSQRIAAKR